MPSVTQPILEIRSTSKDPRQNSYEQKMYGIDFVTEQKHMAFYCKTLAAPGAAGVHFYDDYNSKLEVGYCSVLANHLIFIPTNRGRNVE